MALVATLLVASPVVWAKPDGHDRKRAVDAIIVHSLGGPDCEGGKQVFHEITGDARYWVQRFRTLPLVSIHYVIGRDGDVQTGIPEDRAASHAVGWNQRSIGIELVNNADGKDPFPQVQIDALVALVQAIRVRHPAITTDRILRHSDVDHSMFPAEKFGVACTQYRRKLDPGEAFPWAAFKAAVAQAVRGDGVRPPGF
jgi:N-acetyl-anhydromuramyl-L-alanine amidase AmpD